MDGSSASLKDSRDGLTYVLYKGVNDHTYRDSYVRTMMLDRKKTTIVRGHSSTGRKLNHQWNIDGWLYRMRYIKLIIVTVLHQSLQRSRFHKRLFIVISDGMDYVTVIILAVVLTRRQSLLIRKVG